MLARYPGEVEAYLELARLLAGEVKTEEAVGVVQRGLAVDPGAKDLYNLIANLYAELGRREESFSSARQNIELARDEPNAYDTLAQVEMHFGVYDLALEHLNRSLALKEDFEVARVHLGNLYYRQGRYRDALREYERYTRDTPEGFDRLRGYGLMAWVHFRQGDAAGAAAELRKRFASFEHAPAVVSLTAAVTGVLKPGEFPPSPLPRASRGSRDLLRSDYYWRAQVALKNGPAEDALGLCEQAARERVIVWDAENYEDCAASVFLHSGKWAKARSEYERILQVNPNDALAHYRLGLALERTGALAQAKLENQKFLNLWKSADADIPELIDARRRAAQ
jgi:tetratricopeptide (TPR) repeat protein